MARFLFMNNATNQITIAISAESFDENSAPENMIYVPSTIDDYNSFLTMNPLTHRMIYRNEEFEIEAIRNDPSSIDKTSITANEIDTATISGIHNPSLVIIDDETFYTVTDGIFNFSIDTPGIYSIKIVNSEYLEKEYTINAS